MGKIEDAIQQKEFKDPFNKAVVNLIFTHSYLVTSQNGLFKPHDLSPEQYNVLRILRGQKYYERVFHRSHQRWQINLAHFAAIVKM